MKITFKKLRYKNILSTGNVFTEIDFTKNKTTLISGSNGAGKCVRGSTVVSLYTDDPEEQNFFGASGPSFSSTVLRVYESFRVNFKPNLKVLTRFGFKSIQYADITAKNSKVYTITTEYGDQLSCSPFHKILSRGEWIAASEFKVGSQIETTAGPQAIKSMLIEKKTEDLYDLQVAEVEEYYTNNIVSHNSTMIEAMIFNLYGKPFRKINKGQLLNSVNQKDLLTEQEFSIGKDEFLIRRGIKPNIFEIWKNNNQLNKDSTVRDFQDYLEKNILKMSYKSLTQIVILGSATYVPFMELPAASRREIIEDLLDIQIFSTMNTLAAEQIKQNKQDLKDTEYEVEIKKQSLSSLRKLIESMQTQRDDEINKIKEKAKAILNLLEVKQSSVEELELQIETLSSGLSDKDKFVSKRSALNSARSDLMSKLNRFKEEVSFYHDNDNCPTCRQGIAHDFKGTIIGKREEQITELTAAFEKLDAMEEELNVKMQDFAKLEREISSLNSQIIEKRSELRFMKETLKGYKQELQESVSKEVDATELSDLEKEVLEKQEYYSALTEKKDILLLTSMLLKDGGIKTKIIKQYIPVMNTLINKYLSLFDLFVDFQLNENFEETLKSRFRDTFSYSSFSEGEKMRINLSILLTWRAISKMRNSISTNILILDEILDGVSDEAGVDALISILNALSEQDNIFVISHRGITYSEKFDGHLEFKKVGNFSEYEVLQ